MGKKRIFKTKTFAKWLKSSELTDQDLAGAVMEMSKGLYDADLGSNVFKKRIAIGNRGKSHGVRTIVATKLSIHWFFIFGFEKNERANINNVELAYLQKTAESLLESTSSKIDQLLNDKILIEVKHGGH
jgi:hypothetical protein